MTEQLWTNGNDGDTVCIEFIDDGVRILADIEDYCITKEQFLLVIEAEFGIKFIIVHRSGFWFATGKREKVAV